MKKKTISNGSIRWLLFLFCCNCIDELNFSSVSDDDLGVVDNSVSVDEVSSSSNSEVSSSSEESENENEDEQDIHAWGRNKKNYYGGIEDVLCL